MPESPPPPRRLVVTGASGFLGRVVTKAAIAGGWQVFPASRSAAPPGFRGDWWHMPHDGSAAAVAHWLRRVQPQALFHGAGSASVTSSFETPLDDLQASLGSWSTWLEGARQWGGQPLMVFPSSAAVYGAPESLPVGEEEPRHPISPYGMHKLMCELLAREYHEMLDVPVAVIRLFSVFGGSQRRLLLWEVFQNMQQDPDCVRLMGTGEEGRDYLHESAVAEAVLLLAADRDRWLPEPQLPVFNLGSGTEHRVREVAAQLRDRVRPQHRIVCEGRQRVGDPDRWCADISRFRHAYPNWKPVGLEEGLALTLPEWNGLHEPLLSHLPPVC